MIQIKDVRKAMKLLKTQEFKEGKFRSGYKSLHRTIAASLEYDQFLEEYDGTLESALKCLTESGYEIQPLEPQSEAQDEGVDEV